MQKVTLRPDWVQVKRDGSTVLLTLKCNRTGQCDPIHDPEFLISLVEDTEKVVFVIERNEGTFHFVGHMSGYASGIFTLESNLNNHYNQVFESQGREDIRPDFQR